MGRSYKACLHGTGATRVFPSTFPPAVHRAGRYGFVPLAEPAQRLERAALYPHVLLRPQEARAGLGGPAVRDGEGARSLRKCRAYTLLHDIV